MTLAVDRVSMEFLRGATVEYAEDLLSSSFRVRACALPYLPRVFWPFEQSPAGPLAAGRPCLQPTGVLLAGKCCAAGPHGRTAAAVADR